LNTFGHALQLSIFGEAGGAAVGVVLDGLPCGEEIDQAALCAVLETGNEAAAELSGRKFDPEAPAILSGILDGKTTGAPLCVTVQNSKTEWPAPRPNLPRPGHPDITSRLRYQGFADARGDGAYGERILTAIELAGGVCRQILERRGISLESSIIQVGEARGKGLDYHMRKEILQARSRGDSVGSVIRCTATGVPAGLGGLFFESMESRISAMMCVVPGVAGVAFGSGFGVAALRGSIANDPIRIEGDNIFTETNHAGGLNGGITNGMPLVVRVALRPTPSITRMQDTVDLKTMRNTTISSVGRFDPCLAPRTIPAAEAVLAFCILDAMED
jgi:chorismate synthase